jgi:hypothetical protein
MADSPDCRHFAVDVAGSLGALSVSRPHRAPGAEVTGRFFEAKVNNLHQKADLLKMPLTRVGRDINMIGGESSGGISMNRLLLTAALVALAAPAYADTSLHVTGGSATGADPVLLNENTSFEILDNQNGTAIDSPLTIYFAVPVGDTGPSVTSYAFDSGTPKTTGITLNSLGVWDPAGGKAGDLYTFAGCTKGCDGSINESNVDAVDGAGTKFNVWSLMLTQGFNSQGDDEVIDGLFAKGTIIAPLATDAKGKIADTSWTNTGFVNVSPTSPVPEPSTWAMMISGFGLMAAMVRRQHKARLA